MFFEFITSTIYFILVLLLSISIGRLILERIKYKDSYLVTTSIALLLGFSVLVYTAVVLGLVHLFRIEIIAPIGILLMVLLHKSIITEAKKFFSKFVDFFRSTWRINKLHFIVILIISVIIILNYSATFYQPLAVDEVAYHLPEAQLLVDTHILSFPHGGHYFYGNLPLFMEVAFALGLLLSGTALMHAFHYLLFLAFILFLFGWLKSRYTINTALLGIFGIFGLNEIVVNSTIGYVDAGFFSLEVMGLLLSTEWLYKNRQPNSNATLWVSGAMFGLALSIKYSPIVTIGFVGIAMIIQLLFKQRKRWKTYVWNMVKFGLVILLFGGFWYVKNLFFYGNPFYPLYFGHVGVDEETYRNLIEAIQRFSYDRTFGHYIKFPVYLFWGEKLFQLQSIVMLFVLPLIPFVVFIKKYRLWNIILALYCLVYSIYWFFMPHTRIVFYME